MRPGLPLDVRTLPLLLATLLATCQQSGVAAPTAAPPSAPAEAAVAETIFDGGLAEGWKDYGWAPRKLGAGPARLTLSRKGGWIVARPGLKGSFGGVAFRYRAPASFGDFLEIRVDSRGAEVFPRVEVGPGHRRDVADGWTQVFVPMVELNPGGAVFDRVVLRAFRHVGDEPVLVDKLGLTAGPGPELRPGFEARLQIDCEGPARPISPLIYGIAYDPRLDSSDRHQWQLGATARRWGGNASSRFNWKLGNAWNTANDWFFRNVNYTGSPAFTWRDFLDEDLRRGVQTALTVPTLGWVAKDVGSAGFPVPVFGAQRRTDPYHGDAGDGVRPDGSLLPPGSPSLTSVPLPPQAVGEWVAAIRARDEQRKVRSVQSYILDNEPALWNSTHRDVHPDPVTYDELMDRTLQYGAAVRRADPEAIIAGPAEWGWPGYFFSAADAAAGFRLKPDRRAHGDVPLLAWYLRRLREHEQKTGETLLDVLDVHFYPQGKGLRHGTEGATDPDTNARRLRATRALWDPSYVDESWIGEAIRLVPRLQELIDREYPGRRISLGEWSFGAENHPSGGLALAEALGRFGQLGVYSAFYWTYPARDSYAFHAFRAFRDFDGHGARFLDFAVPTTSAPLVSAFASRDAEGRHLVLVALNLDPSRPASAAFDIGGCGAFARRRLFAMGSSEPGLREEKTVSGESGTFEQVLAPYSVNVFDVELARALPAVAEPQAQAKRGGRR